MDLERLGRLDLALAFLLLEEGDQLRLGLLQRHGFALLVVGDFDDVKAKLAAHGIADLVLFHLERGLGKLRHHLLAAKIIQVAAVLLGARVFGKFLRQFVERLTL